MSGFVLLFKFFKRFFFFFFFLRWTIFKVWGFPGGISGKEPACQCRRYKRFEFDPWVGKIL